MKQGLPDGLGLRHVAAFVAACDERHVGRAALRLHVTQPAVSKTLSELEALVGHRLLHRNRHGTRPTPRGEAFLPLARAVIETLSTAGRALTEAGPRRATVRLGALPTVAASLVPHAVVELRRQHPDLGVVVLTRTNADLLDLVRGGEVDIGLGRMSDPASTEGLTFELLYLEELAFAVRMDHPLLDSAAPEPARLLDFPLVVCTAGTVPHRSAEALFAAHGLRLPASAIEVLDVAVASQIVEASDAVWVAPAGAVRSRGRLSTLAVRANTAGAAEPVGVFRRIDAPSRVEAQALLDAIRTAARTAVR